MVWLDSYFKEEKTKTKKVEIIVKQVRKIVAENKYSSLSKIEKEETTKVCPNPNCCVVIRKGVFNHKLQQIMGFCQLENPK